MCHVTVQIMRHEATCKARFATFKCLMFYFTLFFSGLFSLAFDVKAFSREGCKLQQIFGPLKCFCLLYMSKPGYECHIPFTILKVQHHEEDKL